MPSNLDVISIGSAVLDILLTSDQYKPTPVAGELMLCEIYGGKVDVQDALLASGGAGTNTAVSFARQGLQAAVVAEVGKDIGAQIITDDLQREGVDTSLVVEEPTERTGMSAILVASDGSRSAMTFRGAAHMLTPKDIPFDLLERTPHMHLSSVGNADLIRELLFFCREHTVSVSWNPSKGEIQDIILQSGSDYMQVCDVLFINDQEFAAVEMQKEKLLKFTRTLIVTRGKEGGDIFREGKMDHYQGKSVPVVDETGAGDAFASGFVGARIRGLSTQEAVDAAIANASSVVGFLGAKQGLLHLKG